MDIQLLDCTLRDGGYINDWKFGYDNIVNIFERLADSNVDIVELGFIDARREYDPDRTILPDTNSFNRTYGNLSKKNAMLVTMIDYGTCHIENLQPCSETVLDGIRVIFKKEKMIPALEFCTQVKALGYKVFTQAVSITAYNDEELSELIERVNNVKPYALSMVDTYGLLHQNNLEHILKIIDEKLADGIRIGYHSHNNFQLGYSNSIEVINSNSKHDILVDGSLYGMGKSAGNAPVELTAMYLNRFCGKNYDISQMLEAIEVNLMGFYNKTPWGYKLFYYIAASNNCHPNYVSYLLNKNTLSIASVNELLSKLQGEKKLLYDEKYIETLYDAYQSNDCDDSSALSELKKVLLQKPLLLLGPGNNFINEFDKVEEYIKEYNPLIISINYIPGQLKPDYVFLSNAKRYNSVMGEIKHNSYDDIKTIATSNVMKVDTSFDYVLNYDSLIDTSTEIRDNSLVMFLRVLKNIGARDIALAGFDGYSADHMNYYNTNMEYDFAKEKAQYLNDYTNEFLNKNKDCLSIRFITKTFYRQEA